MGQLAERQRPLRRIEYEHMVAAGFFDNERIELIRGVILEMGPQSISRAAAIQRLTRLLVPPLVGRADVRVQMSFVAGDDSMPEPDLAIVSPVISETSHPDTAFLIIEVANTSLKFDRGVKAELYARVGVAEYWVVDVVDRVIERHSAPASGAYASVVSFRLGDTIALTAFPDMSFPVAAVFGA
jgi:Uma2 family endonuclease